MRQNRPTLATVRRSLDLLCDARMIAPLNEGDQAEFARLLEVESLLLLR